MPLITVITCDRCGKAKGATNHWFKAHAASDGTLLVARFDGELAMQPVRYLCGEGCLQAEVGEWAR